MTINRPFVDLTLEAFLASMPQFEGMPQKLRVVTQEYIDTANCDITENNFCRHTQWARKYFVAHNISVLMEMYQQAELDPDSGGGTNTTSDRISREKVGDVESSYRAPVSGQNGSNENNDPASLEFGTTVYGRKYLSLVRQLCNTVATTGSEYLT